MLDKWLKAGILENGQIIYPKEYTGLNGLDVSTRSRLLKDIETINISKTNRNG